MSDTERVFALYVQVNPVPEPDLLPLTRDEAELLITEGSTVMDTRETIKARPPQRTRRWRPVAVAAAAFVIVLGVVGGVLLLAGGEDELVAAADANPLLTFDGESLTYDGPTEITPGSVEFTVVNNATRDVTLGVWRMSGVALPRELDRTPVGTDRALTPNDPMPAGELFLVADVAAGAQSATTSDLMVAGSTYLVDCVTYAETNNDVYNDHVWRAAAIEVIAP